MKRIFKRTLSIFLAVIILLGSVPIAGFVGVDLPNFSTKAKAIEASDLPEDFDLVAYNVYVNFDEAVGHYGGSFYLSFLNMLKQLSLSQTAYSSFNNSPEFLLAVEAWEAIRMISDPSSVAEALEFQRQYEEVLFAVLFSALSDKKYTEFSYSNTLSKATGLTDKIISSSKTAELLDKTSLDGTEKQELIDTAFAFLTNGKDVESKWSALGEYTDIVNKYISIADDIAGGVISAINIIDSVSMYVSMLDSGAEVIEYLYDLKDKSPNSVFSAAVQTVINTISNDWVGVVEKTIIDVGFVLGMEATDKLIDYAWTGCCAVFPFLTGLYIGGEIGALACNILFGTEDLIEQYEYLKIMTQIEAVSCALYEDYGESCYDSVNSNNASLFTFATRFSYKLYLLAGEAGIEMINIACNKGIISKLITGESFDNFEETAIYILDNSKDLYNNVVNCWKKCIEEDYPEFFKTLTEEEIEPKYIESITMDKDEVTFRVGEIMSYSWTIAPLDYEGSLGIRSDNEAVVKSREPMGIQTYALEENIGTANVTIYSIDNPEICDTIKITVIGEDDEGTTEADSKYVTGKCGGNVTWIFNKDTRRLVINGNGNMNKYSMSSSDNYWGEIKKQVNEINLYGDINNIGNHIFYGFSQLKEVAIYSKIKIIGDGAFMYCNSLEKINIPNSITTIGACAFEDCNIREITIPEDVTSIGGLLFGNDNIEIINYNAKNCTNFSIGTNSGNEMDWLHLNSSIKTINIGPFVEKIPDSISNCEKINVNLQNATFSSKDGVLYDKNYTELIAFPERFNKSTVTIPHTVQKYQYSVFLACKNSFSVAFEEGTTVVPDGAFLGSSINSIKFPQTITKIGEAAFRSCKNLKSVTIPENVTAIGGWAFKDSGISTVEFNSTNCETMGGSNRAVFEGCPVKRIYIGDNVTTIPPYAFYHCTLVENIEIPEKVTEIGECAFWYCKKLSGISITENVTCIGAEAFLYCENLKIIDFNAVNYVTIGPDAFKGCDSIKEINLGNEVTWVNENLFKDCVNLTYVVIPLKAKLNGKVFEGCDNITDVYYVGSQDDWNEMYWGDNVFFKQDLEKYGQEYMNQRVLTNRGLSGSTALHFNYVIQDDSLVVNPSTSSISYGDSIILHVDASKIPEGGYVEWTASNGNFDMDVSSDGTTCKISPSSKGDTTFTATVYDAQGNAVSKDEQVMTSKAGFFDKIIAFFKKLFGLTKTIPQIYKGIF
ncbi:MAG: leucine-rich repeat domain-containing protein [Ruminococcaceae bacterium]|nr:leucine-rich repeat domain-containing protein [Oscillospiraceae bacterium]